MCTKQDISKERAADRIKAIMNEFKYESSILEFVEQYTNLLCGRHLQNNLIIDDDISKNEIEHASAYFYATLRQGCFDCPISNTCALLIYNE